MVNKCAPAPVGDAKFLRVDLLRPAGFQYGRGYGVAAAAAPKLLGSPGTPMAEAAAKAARAVRATCGLAQRESAECHALRSGFWQQEIRDYVITAKKPTFFAQHNLVRSGKLKGFVNLG
jgi:hypothetical protein